MKHKTLLLSLATAILLTACSSSQPVDTSSVSQAASTQAAAESEEQPESKTGEAAVETQPETSDQKRPVETTKPKDPEEVTEPEENTTEVASEPETDREDPEEISTEKTDEPTEGTEDISTEETTGEATEEPTEVTEPEENTTEAEPESYEEQTQPSVETTETVTEPESPEPTEVETVEPTTKTPEPTEPVIPEESGTTISEGSTEETETQPVTEPATEPVTEQSTTEAETEPETISPEEIPKELWISISGSNDVYTFERGEELNTSRVRVYLIYTEEYQNAHPETLFDENVQVRIPISDVTISGFDSNIGFMETGTATITYEGYTASFTYQCVKDIVREAGIAALAVINAERESLGLAPMEWSDKLYEYAVWRTSGDASMYAAYIDTSDPHGGNILGVAECLASSWYMKTNGASGAEVAKFHGEHLANYLLNSTDGHREILLHPDRKYFGAAVQINYDGDDAAISGVVMNLTLKQPSLWAEDVDRIIAGTWTP